MNDIRRSGWLIPATFAFALSLSGAEAESGRIIDLRTKVLDLQFRVTDLAGAPVTLAARIEDLAVNETPTEVRIDLAADVLFEFDKADLLPKAEEVLARAAGLIRERAQGTVRIEGHTDSKGDDAYNQRLSEQRAAAVRDWFVRNGLGNFTFQSSGKGEKEPVASNEKPDGSDDPEGRQKNRRVQIVFTK